MSFLFNCKVILTSKNKDVISLGKLVELEKTTHSSFFPFSDSYSMHTL